MKEAWRAVHSESGHANLAGASLLGAAGAVALGIGAARDTDWLAIAGGVVVGLAFLAEHVARHATLDKSFFRRLDRLEEDHKK